MKGYIYAQMFIGLPSVSVGFFPCYCYHLKPRTAVESKMNFGGVDDLNSDDNAELLLSTSDVNSQMAKLRSKYPTSEADYLAAARARNTAKQVSSERTATDADWRQISMEKQQAVGDIDDWENSRAEAGNTDSQILIPLTSAIGEDGEEEPKLMLF